MNRQNLRDRLRFYFITDDQATGLSPIQQTEIALQAGAATIQYRNKSFCENSLTEIRTIQEMCRKKNALFIVNDDIRLAEQIDADGVHVGQDDAKPSTARNILGKNAVVGVSVSNLAELEKTDLSGCDYIGTGPVFRTTTKADAKPVRGLAGLKEIVRLSPVPVVAIGGITADNARDCFSVGAAGVAVISFIARARDPLANAARLGIVCGFSKGR